MSGLNKWQRLLGAASTGLVMAACATKPATMENCDPAEVDNVFLSARCDAAFEARISAIEARITEINAERRVTEADVSAFNAEAARLAADADQLETRLASMQLQVAQLRSRYQGLSTQTAEQSRIVAEMRNRADAAEAELSRVQEMVNAPAREIAQLNATLEAQQGAIDDLMGLYDMVE